MPNPVGTTYEATLIYLIRRRGKLEVITDCHTIGIYKLQTWLDLLKGVGFDNVSQIRIDRPYDRFLVGEGKYHLLMLVCSETPDKTLYEKNEPNTGGNNETVVRIII